ncbi:MAG TPA: spermidine synthase [Actinomycetota bacterium]|nr:spermidine synthase [Actinomycetota bacterium]
MRSDRVQLVAASFLMLMTELVLIRWAGSYVVYLSYFSNFVLLGSFLGIGIGFLRGHRNPDLFRLAPLALAIFFVAVMAFRVTLDRSGGDLVYFGSLATKGLPIWVMLPFIFLSVAAVMATIAHGVAQRFSKFPALEAYRLDILGSLCGIVMFAAMSLLSIPPVGWGIVIVGLFCLLLWPVHLLQSLAGVAILGTLLAATLAPNTTWSPYYRILFHPNDLAIDVNGIPHQTMENIADSPLYNEPYHLVDRPPGNVLVIGAGNGNDVAAALAAGATHVDAVEIDPAIQKLGVEHHPDHPYDDPRVTQIVGDGRSFLERTDNTYDMIMLALPDSLTLVSGQGSVRLESFLFTQQAMQAAKDHLAPDGAFAMYNYYREPWLLDRFAGTLQDVYGHAPCLYTGPTARDQVIGGLSMLVVGVDQSTVTCQGDGTRIWQASGPVVAPATDDRPFPYLKTPSIPARYLWTLGLILLVSAIAVRLAGGRFGSMRGYLDLFFMGAGFLLLETKSVVQFALLFGTTWFVNALVFAGVLLTVLIAIEVEQRTGVRKRTFLYPLLFVGLLIAGIVPASWLLSLEVVPRFFVASALAFFPVFIANLVFASRFRDAEDPTTAFGANLLGAMLGGVLEYMALITGYRGLLVIAALLYALAWVFGARKIGGERTETPQAEPALDPVGPTG